MCANADDIKPLIVDNLAKLDVLLYDWERQCALLGDNRHHFLHIHSCVDKVKYHVRRIKLAEKTGGGRREGTLKRWKVAKEVKKKVGAEEKVKCQGELVREEKEVIMNIPADVIEKKILQEKTTVTFRNKEIRKGPSWKYLDKWKEILDEEWSRQRNSNLNQEDFNGVNIIVPKRIQQFGGSKKQKFNSTECILDEVVETKLEPSHKRFVSEGDLMDDFDAIISDIDRRNSFHGPNYLLSLRDLQSFDKLDNLDCLSSDSEETNDECDTHKPKIVGVIYKDKL